MARIVSVVISPPSLETQNTSPRYIISSNIRWRRSRVKPCSCGSYHHGIRREHGDPGGYAASGIASAFISRPGYQRLKMPANSPFSVRTRVCSNRCAPSLDHCICCFGDVSKAAIDKNNGLQINLIGVTISTSETLPLYPSLSLPNLMRTKGRERTTGKGPPTQGNCPGRLGSPYTTENPTGRAVTAASPPSLPPLPPP